MPSHRTDIQMRFGDTDALGHVNNASLATYAEVARLDFLQGFGRAVTSLILASLYLDYRKQVGFGDTVYVDTWVEKLGRSSIVLRQTIVANGDRAVDVKSVVVHFDYADGKSLALTDDMRRALDSYLQEEKEVP
ncbi:MAG TPA: thioesterase family protein [Gemmatimonadaceae bacterium]